MGGRTAIFVNAFNHLTFVRATVEFLSSVAGADVFVVDNCSTYEPLLDWYATRPCEVLRLPVNYGHLAPWRAGLVERYATDEYAVTDCDLELETLPAGFLESLRETLRMHPKARKCGVALRIDDLSDHFPLKQQVRLWESRFWGEPIGIDTYRAPIDTTFAVYSRFRPLDDDFYSGIRLAGAHTVRHRPWYWRLDSLSDEDLFYLATTEVSPGWKKVLLHLLCDEGEDRRARVEHFLADGARENWRSEREFLARAKEMLVSRRPERVLISSANDGSLAYFVGRLLQELGRGVCVTFTGYGESHQACRRLLLGLPVETRSGSILDAPTLESFDVTLFSGQPNAIQYVEYRHAKGFDVGAIAFQGDHDRSALPHFIR